MNITNGNRTREKIKIQNCFPAGVVHSNIERDSSVKPVE
jgi:hypothetical protein